MHYTAVARGALNMYYYYWAYLRLLTGCNRVDKINYLPKYARNFEIDIIV
jgi:hypothetical protein